MSRCCAKVILILWMATLCLGKANYDVRCESIENLKGDEETLFEFEFKILGRDRVLNGSANYHVDMDEQYDVWVDIATFKNRQWIPMNLKLRIKPCDFMRNVFARFFASSFLDSNFLSEDMCPMRKGQYYLKNVALSTDNWPSFLIKGLNKCRFAFMKDGKVVGGFELVINLFDRNT